MNFLEILDGIADDLENRGYIKEAYDIDLISNFIEKESFTDSPKIPAIKQAIKDAFKDRAEEVNELTKYNLEFKFFGILPDMSVVSKALKNLGYIEIKKPSPNPREDNYVYLPRNFNPRDVLSPDPAVTIKHIGMRDGGQLVYASITTPFNLYEKNKSEYQKVLESEPVKMPEKVPEPMAERLT